MCPVFPYNKIVVDSIHITSEANLTLFCQLIFYQTEKKNPKYQFLTIFVLPKMVMN